MLIDNAVEILLCNTMLDYLVKRKTDSCISLFRLPVFTKYATITYKYFLTNSNKPYNSKTIQVILYTETCKKNERNLCSCFAFVRIRQKLLEVSLFNRP